MDRQSARSDTDQNRGKITFGCHLNKAKEGTSEYTPCWRWAYKPFVIWVQPSTGGATAELPTWCWRNNSRRRAGTTPEDTPMCSESACGVFYTLEMEHDASPWNFPLTYSPERKYHKPRQHKENRKNHKHGIGSPTPLGVVEHLCTLSEPMNEKHVTQTDKQRDSTWREYKQILNIIGRFYHYPSQEGVEITTASVSKVTEIPGDQLWYLLLKI